MNREAFKEKNPFATVKATYFNESGEVALETKNHFNNTMTTTMLKIAQMQDRAMLEALPDEVLSKLYQTIKLQMQSRGLLLNS